VTGHTVSDHAWLRRVSDYHSGGVSDAERAAVEVHLATCADCQQTLAEYRRFYALARSPLRLGPPSPPIMREQPMRQTTERFDAPPGGRPPDPRTPRRRLYVTAAAGLAAALVVAGFLAVFAGRLEPRGGHPSATATHSATPSIMPTASPVPTVNVSTLPPPGTGYVQVGPSWARFLTFAPSAPSTAYACGDTTISADATHNSGPIALAASTDGGHTWQTRATPAVDGECQISVDPSNPADLIMLTATCAGTSDTCQPAPVHAFRSSDGGGNWAAATAPQGAAWDFSKQMVWLGSTLFVPLQTGLARSDAGGPFGFIPVARYEVGPDITSSSDVRPVDLFTANGRLFVELSVCDLQNEAAPCRVDYAVTDAAAASWTGIGMRFQSLDVTVSASGADSHTLLGNLYPADSTQPLTYLPVLTSTDGGASWTELPAYASPLLCCSNYNSVQLLAGRPQAAAAAPDGTVLVYLIVIGGGGAGGIYALAPGSPGWRYVMAPPSESFAAFQFDLAGHPAAIWGVTANGLQYRRV
jgi:hypothetical protein